MPASVKLMRRIVFVDAPRETVFQVATALGTGNLPGGESAKVLSRTGNTIAAEFKTRGGFRMYTTVGEITLHPPDRVAFKRVSGPLRSASVELILEEVEHGTKLESHGGFIWNKAPILGWLIGVLFVKSVVDAAVARQMWRIKKVSEERAKGSQAARRKTE
ncbi:MAG: SRPBCC family protein [SAR202 cluster bacterium]|nr:SRPBCC family protein [SAR202 cluster bacterium]